MSAQMWLPPHGCKWISLVTNTVHADTHILLKQHQPQHRQIHNECLPSMYNHEQQRLCIVHWQLMAVMVLMYLDTSGYGHWIQR